MSMDIRNFILDQKYAIVFKKTAESDTRHFNIGTAEFEQPKQ